jgi:hypothetical protein
VVICPPDPAFHHHWAAAACSGELCLRYQIFYHLKKKNTMKKLMKNALMAMTIVLGFGMSMTACKKEEANPVTACFNDAYNGTYTGNLVSGGTPTLGTTVKVTKTGCQTADLTGPVLGTVRVTQLAASNNGGFAGKSDNGSDISIAVNGNNIEIAGAVNFNGSK